MGTRFRTIWRPWPTRDAVADLSGRQAVPKPQLNESPGAPFTITCGCLTTFRPLLPNSTLLYRPAIVDRISSLFAPLVPRSREVALWAILVNSSKSKSPDFGATRTH